MKTRYPNVTVNPDRHGKLRARFRKTGHQAVYMKSLPDQPGFKAEYEALLANPARAPSRAIPGSVDDLAVRYYASAAFAGRGSPAARSHRRSMIEYFRSKVGGDQITDFGFEHIEAILLARVEKVVDDRGLTSGGQVSASNLRKELRRFFAYAVKLKWIAANPVDHAEHIGLRRIKGHHTWSEAEIAQYQATHPIGTKARLALEIILWTGQRKGDVLRFGPKHIVRGKINFQASKNDADLWMPLAPDLRAAIAAMPSIGLTTFLVTSYGNPYTSKGFGKSFRRWCDAAGLPQCAAHGLRKAIARRMAEGLATQQEIKAVGGWKHDAEVAIYVANAAQERLADSAFERLVQQHSADPTP